MLEMSGRLAPGSMRTNWLVALDTTKVWTTVGTPHINCSPNVYASAVVKTDRHRRHDYGVSLLEDSAFGWKRSSTARAV